ncbi:MAG: long-chain fatty acid--CoA ligase [Betaproteobacteria bacterium]|nr:long-chain fatty acid--CoA ligase [Betaproteobacteria bacterium]
MNLARILAHAAAKHPGRPAISRGSKVVHTYSALAHRVARLAAVLREKFRLAPGDRVALAMTNSPPYLELLFGIWHAGLAAVPINAKLHQREFAYILENSGAKVCFVSPDLADTIAPLPREIATLERVIVAGDADYEELLAPRPAACADVNGDDLVWLFYTSGTTGRPKGAMLSHRNLKAMSDNYLEDVDAITERDCIIHAAPMSHGSGLYGLPHVLAGANNVIPESGGFEVEETLGLIARWPGATFFFAPTMVKRLIHSPAFAGANTSNLKTIVYGGAPMYLEDCLEALEKLGPKLVQIYGQGESPMTIAGLSRDEHMNSSHPRYHERLASVGRARQGVEVRVVNANDEPLPPGEVGEIVVRGEVVMKGYWQNPQATSDALRGGWLHTGDMGAFDADGFLTLKDRSRDLIISGGSNIYPREVEEAILHHPGVLEVSVVGRPHADWGEEVVAFVVAKPGANVTAEDLDAVCLQHIARFKRPKDYFFLEALPKNNYGKVLKTELRAQLLTG